MRVKVVLLISLVMIVASASANPRIENDFKSSQLAPNLAIVEIAPSQVPEGLTTAPNSNPSIFREAPYNRSL